jgi:osmoprotectant transport system ATP-binding protein
MSAIQINGVTKSYGQKLALNSVTLVFPPKRTTAIIGPSGGGKSTVLQLINGLVRPDSGVVHVYGEPIDYKRLPELRREIGYAVQGTGLFPHLTIERNISLLARLNGWDRDRTEKRVAELMAMVNLPVSFKNRYPYQLSGGERQRVGLCRTMMLDPDIWLLDEAFGALDPITRSEIHREFLKLQQEKARTIILVTHDLREAFRLADHVVIINSGRLEQVGSREEILKNPASPFVEEFVHLQLEDEIKFSA